MSRSLHIAFVIDSVVGERAGGLVSGSRMIEHLRARHRVTSIGVGGDLALEPLELPFIQGLVRDNSFEFARPDPGRMEVLFASVDVVHVLLPFFLGFSAMRVAHQKGLPVVTAHHVQPENAFANLGLRAPRLARLVDRPLAVRLLNRLVVKTFYNRAQSVVCPSHLAMDELVRAGLKAPSVIISNGVPEEFVPLPSREPGRFTVLSVGRMVPEKRHDLILEAVRRSRHAEHLKLVIAGRGPLEHRLLDQAHGIPAEIRIGFVSDQELLRLYQTSDLYVHASEVELEGIAPLEAMRCGCPALLADAKTSASKQFALSPAHLFHTGDPVSLAQRIDHWFEHRDELESARAATLEAVQHFNMAETIAAYEGLYLELAEHRPLPPGSSSGHNREPPHSSTQQGTRPPSVL